MIEQLFSPPTTTSPTTSPGSSSSPVSLTQTKTDERTEILDRFRAGVLDARHVTGARRGHRRPGGKRRIILSGSASKRQYAQRLGRILRPTDDRQPARLYEIITEDTMETYVSQTPP